VEAEIPGQLGRDRTFAEGPKSSILVAIGHISQVFQSVQIREQRPESEGERHQVRLFRNSIMKMSRFAADGA